MSFDLTLEEQQLLAETHRRVGLRMPRRDRIIETLTGLGFIGAAAVVWLERPPTAISPVTAFLAVIVMVLASQVSFETPLGVSVASQLGFVPLMFALPVAMVPIAVVVSVALSGVPAVRAGRMRAGKLVQSFSNAWFSIGPVMVFAFAHVDPVHAGPLLLLAALLAQFAGDFMIFSLRAALERSVGLVVLLRDCWSYGVDAALSVTALFIAQDIHKSPLLTLAPLPLLALLAIFARERRERMTGLLELNSAYRGMALALGDVVEADDSYTGEHCKSVVKLAVEISHQLDFDAEQLRDLEFGALLHDVGKVAIPKEIINKPGKLNDEEWAIMVTHTTEGQKILEQVGGFMTDVGLIVRSHHERWDGRGYPDGLAGDRIPLAARIVACCDSWNAMRTDRAYRAALPHEVAVAELVRNSGKQFDPKVVEAFLRVIKQADDATFQALGGRPDPAAAIAPEDEPIVVAA
jgi:putative nucleotidyltransferase with HDIG domain